MSRRGHTIKIDQQASSSFNFDQMHTTIESIGNLFKMYILPQMILHGKSTVISSLTSSDLGPISTEFPYIYSHWYKKVISSTHNKMMVELNLKPTLQAQKANY